MEPFSLSPYGSSRKSVSPVPASIGARVHGMTARARFKQSDLTRALKAAKLAGERVLKYEIDPNGRIVVYTDRAANDVGPTGWEGL